MYWIRGNRSNTHSRGKTSNPLVGRIHVGTAGKTEQTDAGHQEDVVSVQHGGIVAKAGEGYGPSCHCVGSGDEDG